MRITVKVHAGAKRDSVKKLSETRYEVSVREAAAQNAANIRLVQIIAAHFGVSAKQVRIIKGHHSPAKHLFIRT